MKVHFGADAGLCPVLRVQIENMKMHFEAQMEQLNRELLSTKAELNSVKGALAAQAQPPSQSATMLSHTER